jgi:hypothetical protein
MADRGPDQQRRNVGDTSNAGQPTDAGRTSGGGSLGHDQPADVEEQTHTRNKARDPVMPDDGSTLNTKI